MQTSTLWNIAAGRSRRRGGWVLQATRWLAPPIVQGFTQQYIESVNPPLWTGADLRVSWTADPPAGAIYQVYVDGSLQYHGTSPWCSIPMPTSLASIAIGTVGPQDGTTDFSATIPAAPSTQALLTWTGGTYEAADISGFYVFGGGGPGLPVDFTNAIATIPAYTAGMISDGFGLGGFGLGGFGAASASYSWQSGSLSAGTWNFAVVPYDQAGNLGTITTTSVAISCPPLPPAPYADMTRLKYTFNPVTEEITLSWNPSPG